MPAIQSSRHRYPRHGGKQPGVIVAAVRHPRRRLCLRRRLAHWQRLFKGREEDLGGAAPAENPERKYITPPQIARRLGSERDKVLALIRSGELRAIDLAIRASSAIGMPPERTAHRRRDLVERPNTMRRQEEKDLIDSAISHLGRNTKQEGGSEAQMAVRAPRKPA